MASVRRRLLLFVALVLGCSSLLAGPVGAPASGQVPTSPTSPIETTTTSTPGTTAEPEPTSTGTQTLVDGGPTSESRVASESRRVLALIGGLVAVALALTLLTIRYWRITRPVPPAVDAVAEARPLRPPAIDRPATDRATSGRAARWAVAGADHAEADADWNPRGTGETDRVRPQGRLPRPGVEARRRALERPAGS